MKKMLRRPVVEQRTGLSRSTIYELMAKGLFPKPYPLTPGGRAKGWADDEIDSYQQARIAEREARS